MYDLTDFIIHETSTRNKYRKGYKKGYKDGYAKGIEEFAEALNAKITEFVLEHQEQLVFVSGVGMGWRFVEEVAEQLKGE